MATELNTQNDARDLQPSGEVVSIRCADGFALSGLWFTPAPNDAPRTLVLNSGTGIPKEFYLRFASYAARRGFGTLIYDYRGIRGSRPQTLKGFNATMSDWGTLDMGAALQFVKERMPNAKRYVVGHSVGGQLLPSSHEADSIDAAALIASSTGSWTQMQTFGYRMFCALIWYGVVPATTSMLGYLPAKTLRQGEDLPLGVAREWSAWCKQEDYFARILPKEAFDRYAAFRAPIWSLSFTDDPIANSATVPALLSHYTNTDITRAHLSPKEVGLDAVGHLGFFSRKAAHLWDGPLNWFLSHSLSVAANHPRDKIGG